MVGKQIEDKQIVYIQGLIDFDNKVIESGIMLCGKCCSLDDAHIKRIYAAIQKEIDRIKNE